MILPRHAAALIAGFPPIDVFPVEFLLARTIANADEPVIVAVTGARPMTLEAIPAAVRNLRQANANLHQAARLLDDAGYKDHADRVRTWAADVTKLADAGVVTAQGKTAAKPPAPRAAKTPAVKPLDPEGLTV